MEISNSLGKRIKLIQRRYSEDYLPYAEHLNQSAEKIKRELDSLIWYLRSFGDSMEEEEICEMEDRIKELGMTYLVKLLWQIRED